MRYVVLPRRIFAVTVNAHPAEWMDTRGERRIVQFYVRQRTDAVFASAQSGADGTLAQLGIFASQTGKREPGVIYGDGHITECAAGYVRVDFRSCSAAELSEVYRAFAVLCINSQANGALLKAGDDYAPGHHGVRDAFQAMAMRAVIPTDFKLALIPSTRPIEAVYREAQQDLRAAGFNAWVFSSENEAVDWLEGRTTSGEMVS